MEAEAFIKKYRTKAALADTKTLLDDVKYHCDQAANELGYIREQRLGHARLAILLLNVVEERLAKKA